MLTIYVIKDINGQKYGLDTMKSKCNHYKEYTGSTKYIHQGLSESIHFKSTKIINKVHHISFGTLPIWHSVLHGSIRRGISKDTIEEIEKSRYN